jgi:hypothetical protein
MAQTFIEEIGVPTVKQWVAAAHKLEWSLTQKGAITTPSNYFPHFVLPPATPGSAHYIFHGHPYGSLSMLTPPSNASSASSSTNTQAVMLPSSQASGEYFSEEPDSTTLALMDATEELADLRV